MKFFLTLIAMISLVSCARNLEPTVENINKIFASKDFTFQFNKKDGTCQSLSFIDDIVVYKSDQQTIRREITYKEVLFINDFIQKILNVHSNTLDPEIHSNYILKNTAYKVTIVPNQEDFYFDALIKTLELKDSL